MPEFYRRNVQDQSGSLFANAVLEALDARRQRQREDRLDAERAQDRARATALQNYQLGEQGVRLTTDDGAGLTKGIPFQELGQIGQGVRLTGDTAADAGFRQTVQRALMPVEGARRGSAGFDERPSAAPLQMVAPFPSLGYRFGPGYVVNRDQEAARRQEGLMAGFNAAVLKAMGEAQGKVAGGPEGSALARLLTQSTIAKNTADAARSTRPSDGPVVNATTGIYRLGATGGAAQPVVGPDGRPLVPRPPVVQPPNFQIIPTDQGYVGVNPKQPTQQIPLNLQPRQTQVPAQVIQAVNGNRRQLNTIDQAIQLLREHPTAVGIRRTLPDALNQVLDPEGVPTRAAVSDVGSLLIHDRTGAAMNAAESMRLKPFIPGPNDQSAAAIQKLERLKAALQMETDLLQASYEKAQRSATPTTPATSPPDAPQTAPLPGFSPSNPFAPRP